MVAVDLPVLAFGDVESWERWLRKNGATSKGLWLKFSKAGAATPTLKKSEAIEGAICHGWIDGQLAGFDEHYFLTRFTPRRRDSPWSEINRKAALRLIAAGRVCETGLREIEAAKANGRWDKAYSQSKSVVPADLQAALKTAPAAGRFFEALDRVNRFAVIYRVNDAKKAETRAKRIAQYVEMLARGETLHPRKKG
jgi:uncharacterized protein YdeI (YjbR/CyaY-like superfamily)